MTFKEQFDTYKCYINDKIEEVLNNIQTQPKLKSALAYSLRAGGKRLRPLLFIATLDSFGIDYNDYAKLAVAIECVHTYSLIHDDLPGLDNDDYRRGMPSNHKMFGEGLAILAGDALLNLAIQLSLDSVNSKQCLDAIKLLFDYSGINGMLSGQACDLYYENKTVENPEFVLNEIEELKTGKLLTAPFLMASLIASGIHYDDFYQIGVLTGRIFQLSDDLLDAVGTFEDLGKSIGKDAVTGKLTAISVYGIDGTKKLIDETYLSIIKILKKIDNNSFFIDFYDYIKNRNN